MNPMEEPAQASTEAGAAAKQEAKREIIEFAKMVVWFLLIFFVLRTYVIEGYEVQGPSMIPTLHDRERILVFKLPQVLSQWFPSIEPLREGDVVVFDSPPDDPGKRYVKRVIAKGPPRTRGNTVDASPQDNGVPNVEAVPVQISDGIVYVNSKRLDENYINKEEPLSDETLKEVWVGPGHYYVMGDNRNPSKDSRFFGPIDYRHVVGRAILRFWPLSKFGLL